MTSTIHSGQNLPQHPRQLFDTGYVVVVPRHVVYTAHGAVYREGTPVKVVCDIEGKAVQAGMFANSGEEDTNMQSQGGLRQLTDYRIIARAWPGDILSVIWMPIPGLAWPDRVPGGDLLEAVGHPVFLDWGSHMIQHVQVMARIVADHCYADDPDVRTHGWRMPDVPAGGEVLGR